MPATRRRRARPMTSKSSEALMRRFVRDRAASDLEQLLALHWKPTYALALRCLGDPAAAEDVAAALRETLAASRASWHVVAPRERARFGFRRR